MGGKIYSFFFYSFGLSSILVLLITLFVTKYIGYLPVFLLCSAMTVGSFVLIFKFKEVSPWKKDESKLLEDFKTPTLQ